jgi:hypothetical protein
MRGWSCRHWAVWHATIRHTIWVSESAKCRVMLGGEIYYRAIGRPWGPAADSLTPAALTAVRVVWARGHWQAAWATREVGSGATQAFKFKSGSCGQLEPVPKSYRK